MKKFELTANVKMWFGKKLFQIRALISFGNVTAGDLGGYVESERNLDHDGNAWVYGDARVSGNAWVYGDAWVSGNADYLVVGPIGSRNDFTTFYHRKDGVTMVVCGCFHDTIDDFEKAVSETHGNNIHAAAYKALIQVARARLNTEPVDENSEVIPQF